MGVYGVVTDIHGNREALAVALDALEQRGVSRLVCLGDLVGYNADSDEVVRVLAEREAVCIAGNHDLIALGKLGFERCWYRAAHALQRTRDTLARSTREYLEALPGHAVLDERVLLVHGDLGDAQHYMRTPLDIAASAARVRARFPRARACLFGHTHDPRVYRARSDGAARVFTTGAVSLEAGRDELVYVNPGSIDGQRKHPTERRAQLAILDTDRMTIELLDVPYDAAAVERRARDRGFRMDRTAELAHASRRLLSRARRVAQKIL